MARVTGRQKTWLQHAGDRNRDDRRDLTPMVSINFLSEEYLVNGSLVDYQDILVGDASWEGAIVNWGTITAQGQPSMGNGVILLPALFSVLGADFTVVVQWLNDDTTSAQFLLDYYRTPNFETELFVNAWIDNPNITAYDPLGDGTTVFYTPMQNAVNVMAAAFRPGQVDATINGKAPINLTHAPLLELLPDMLAMSMNFATWQRVEFYKGALSRSQIRVLSSKVVA